MHRRATTIAAAAVTAVLTLALTGCGGDGTSKSGKDRKPAASESVDCTSQEIGQAEWLEHCADAVEREDDAEEAVTLKFGQPYKFSDGVKVIITQAEKITRFGEYDSQPEPNQTAFRVHVTIENGSKRPLDLDEVSLLAEGATSGGEAEFTTFEAGAAEIAGRLAPGVRTVKNNDWVLDEEYGKQVLVTVQRISKDVDLFDEPPTWTGPIR